MQEETSEEMIERYADAVQYFIDNPQAPLDPVLKAFVESIKRDIEAPECDLDPKQAKLS